MACPDHEAEIRIALARQQQGRVASTWSRHRTRKGPPPVHRCPRCARPVALGQGVGVLSALAAHDPATEVVRRDVDATVEAAEAGLVGRVVVGGPLQRHVHTGPGFVPERAGRDGPRGQATGEEGRAGHDREDLGCRPAEGGVAADVAREGGGHEGRPLVGHPLDGADPVDAAELARRVIGVAGPGPHGDLAHVVGQLLVARARCGRLGRDELHQPRHQWQSVGMVRGQRRVARLAQATHPADHADGAGVVVVALGAPRRDRRIMHRPVEGEVHLHVPLERVEHGTRAPDAPLEAGVIHDRVGQRVPVARRRLRVGTVGPELGQHPPEVGPRHQHRRVRLTGGRIALVTGPVVGTERGVPEGGGTDVDQLTVARVEGAAEADDLDGRRLELVVGERVTQARRRSGIDGHPVLARIRQGERMDEAPVRPDERLRTRRLQLVVLGDGDVERQRLPVVGIVHVRTGGLDDHGLVDRGIVPVDVAPSLAGAVA